MNNIREKRVKQLELFINEHSGETFVLRELFDALPRKIGIMTTRALAQDLRFFKRKIKRIRTYSTLHKRMTSSYRL